MVLQTCLNKCTGTHGAHHVNGAWASPLCRAHDVDLCGVHQTDRSSRSVAMQKRVSENATGMCGAHRVKTRTISTTNRTFPVFMRSRSRLKRGAHHADRSSASFWKTLPKQDNTYKTRCCEKRAVCTAWICVSHSATHARPYPSGAPNRDLEIANPQRKGLVYS